MAEEDAVAAAETPDLVQPFIACRSWTVNKRGPVPGDDTSYQLDMSPDPPWRLWSTGMENFAWKSGVNEATCHGSYENQPHPIKGCSCGFYALATWEQLFKDHPSLRPESRHNSFRAYGTVELWGVVVPGTRGYRATKARVRSLVLPTFPVTGNLMERWENRNLLRGMRGVVRLTAEQYGVPVVEHLEELSPPFVEEKSNEHRKGTGTGGGGTSYTTGTLTWGTNTNPFTGTSTGTSSSLTGFNARRLNDPEVGTIWESVDANGRVVRYCYAGMHAGGWIQIA